jgi:cbb3-type cytochrome oxidase maturation protein
MDALYLLVPLSVLGMLAILALFAWALQGGQFDEIAHEGARILEPQDAAGSAPTAESGGPVLDAGQGGAGVGPEESGLFENASQGRVA